MLVVRTKGDSQLGGDCLRSIDVFVLAGGLGTRLRPVIGDLPKVLAPVGGRPFLVHLLDWLRAFHAHRVLLGLGHGAQEVLEYLRRNPQPDLSITASIEPRQLGTAGAIRFARPQLRSDPVLVVNGDSYTDADLCALVLHHHAAGAAGTILCAEVEDGERYGRLVIDKKGRISGFSEKQVGNGGGALISAGVYVLSAAMLDDIANTDVVSLERDVFECLPPGSLAAFRGSSSFIDIGTQESFQRCLEIVARAGEQAGTLHDY